MKTLLVCLCLCSYSVAGVYMYEVPGFSAIMEPSSNPDFPPIWNDLTDVTLSIVYTIEEDQWRVDCASIPELNNSVSRLGGDCVEGSVITMDDRWRPLAPYLSDNQIITMTPMEVNGEISMSEPRFYFGVESIDYAFAAVTNENSYGDRFEFWTPANFWPARFVSIENQGSQTITSLPNSVDVPEPSGLACMGLVCFLICWLRTLAVAVTGK